MFGLENNYSRRTDQVLPSPQEEQRGPTPEQRELQRYLLAQFSKQAAARGTTLPSLLAGDKNHQRVFPQLQQEAFTDPRLAGYAAHPKTNVVRALHQKFISAVEPLSVAPGFSSSDLQPAPAAAAAPAAPVASTNSQFATTASKNDSQTLQGFIKLQGALFVIPKEEKQEYLEALERAPDLVMSESDPLRFLRFHDYNAQSAAWSLIRYWKNRKEVFGQDRAFLPITITGRGALNEEDIACIKTGYVVFLPQDNEGHSVLYYDPSRRPTVSIETRIRASFYWGQVMIENPLSQTSGYKAIVLLNNPKHDPASNRSANIIVDTFPGKYKSSHIFDCRPRTGLSFFPFWFVKAMVEKAGRFFFGFQMHVHQLKLPHEIISELLLFGFQREGLPGLLGGSLSDQWTEQWLNSRMTLEQERVSQHAHRQHQTQPAIATTKQPPKEAPRHPTQERILPRTHGTPQEAAASPVKKKMTMIDRASRLPLKKRGRFRQVEDNTSILQEATKLVNGTMSMVTDDSSRSGASHSLEQAALQVAAPVAAPPKSALEDAAAPVVATTAAPLPQKTALERAATPEDPTEPQGLRELFKTEAKKLPKSDAAAYHEALKKAPEQVWKEECNESLFMRVDRSDVPLAVRRLAKYWKIRSKTFGSKKYFKPLYQTGEDALGRKDLSVLGTGFVNLLPNDEDGCSVLWIDGSRLPETGVKDNRNRCLFYMFSLLSENEASLDQGAVLLFKADPLSCGRLDAIFLQMLAQAMPVRFKAVHLLSQKPIPQSFRSEIDFAEKITEHVSVSRDVLCERLEVCGMRKASLPRYLNGDWGYAKFIHWQELRTRMEWHVPLFLSGREKLESGDFPAIRPYEVLPEDQKVERSRRLNVIHCRRKRDRVLVETNLLKEQCADLQESQCALVEENQRLQELVSLAVGVTTRTA